MRYSLYCGFFMMAVTDEIPSLSATKAVLAISLWVSLTPTKIPVRMVSWRDSSNSKLNSLSCSQMNPMVRMETSLTMRS